MVVLVVETLDVATSNITNSLLIKAMDCGPYSSEYFPPHRLYYLWVGSDSSRLSPSFPGVKYAERFTNSQVILDVRQILLPVLDCENVLATW